MTIEEFNRTGWKINVTAKYHGDGKTYPVLSVDFGEQLVGLKGAGGVEDEIYWARCENVTLNAPNTKVSHE